MITDDKNITEFNLKYIDLREKYAEIIYNAIDTARDLAVELTTKVVSEELLNLIDENNKLKKWIKVQTKLFYKSEEYLSEQKRLKSLNAQLESCEESEKEELQKQISKAMATIVTLNLTIKNRLSSQSEKVKLNDDYIDGQVKLLDGDLQEVKSKVMAFLRDKIAVTIKDYNNELNELRKAYGYSELTETELPIDKNLISLDVPIFSITNAIKKSTTKKQTDSEEDVSTEENKKETTQTFISSENTSDVKN